MHTILNLLAGSLFWAVSGAAPAPSMPAPPAQLGGGRFHAGAAAASPTALLVLALLLTIAVYIELKERRIPNWLTLPGMASGLLIGYLNGTPLLLSSLGGLVIGFGFLFIFYVFGGVGGGDVKLMGAAGALLGARLIQPALFYTAVLGALLAMLMFIWRKDFWARIAFGLRRLAHWGKSDSAAMPSSQPVAVPYGLAIAAGCLLTILVKTVI